MPLTNPYLQRTTRWDCVAVRRGKIMSSHISTSMTFLFDDGSLHLCTQDDGEFDARVVDFLADAKYEPVVFWIGRDTEANVAFLRNLEDTAGITIGGLVYGTGTYAGRVGAETCGSNGGSEAESVRLCMFRDSWQLLDSRGLLSSSQIFTRVKVLFCTDPREGALRALEHLCLLPDYSVNGVEDLVPVDDVLGIPLCPPYAVPFGMHMGKHIGQVPASYIRYMKTKPNPSVQLRAFFAYYDLFEDTPRVRSAHWDALEATMRTIKHNTVLQSPGNCVVDWGMHLGKQLGLLEPNYIHFLATTVASERAQKLAADYYDLWALPAPVNAFRPCTNT